MAEQSFIHCENSNDHLTLHDCVAEKAYLKDGALVFEFKDGFWISPEHPENSHGKMLRTDDAKVEFVLAKGSFDAYAKVSTRSVFKKEVCEYWDIEQLIAKINSEKCPIQFCDQYYNKHTDNYAILCYLLGKGKYSWSECWLFVSQKETKYYWNNLCTDKTW